MSSLPGGDPPSLETLVALNNFLGETRCRTRAICPSHTPAASSQPSKTATRSAAVGRHDGSVWGWPIDQLSRCWLMFGSQPTRRGCQVAVRGAAEAPDSSERSTRYLSCPRTQRSKRCTLTNAASKWITHARAALLIEGWSGGNSLTSRSAAESPLGEAPRSETQDLGKLKIFLSPHADHLNYAERLQDDRRMIGRCLNANSARRRTHRVSRTAGQSSLSYSDQKERYLESA